MSEHTLALVAGRPSHPSGCHEFRAGALLLAKCLATVPELTVHVYDDGTIPRLTPDRVDAVAIFSDGGAEHPLLRDDGTNTINELAEAGVGIGVMHYAVEAPPGEPQLALERLIGGSYVTGFSCNPIWEARFDTFPDHAIARGVQPFAVEDEWYFNIHFPEGRRNDRAELEPILVANPSDAVRGGSYVHPPGPYEHIVAAAGRAETLMWALERANGARAFGFNGGHFHANWGNDQFRRVVLNALVWITGREVPPGGVESSISEEELRANLDEKSARDREADID